MKYRISLLFILSLAIFFFSCKKDSENKRTVELEYRVGPSLGMVSRITYTDASGAEAVKDLPTGQTTLTVSPPFTSKMTANVDNYTPTTMNFTLTILVDGESKAVKEFAVGANSEDVETVQYEIE